jgi:hypothetical protein
MCSLKDPRTIYLSLFAAELDNPDSVSDISESTCLLVSEDILKLLIYCVDRHPDPVQRTKSKFNLCHTYCQGKSIDTLLTEEMYKQVLRLVVSTYDNLPDSTSRDLLEKLCRTTTYNSILGTYLQELFSLNKLPEINNISTRLVLDLFNFSSQLNSQEPLKAVIEKLIYNHIHTTIELACTSVEEGANVRNAHILLNSLVDHPEYEKEWLNAIPSFYRKPDNRSTPIIVNYPNLLNCFAKNRERFKTEFQNLALALIEAYDSDYNPILFSQEKFLDTTATAITTFEPNKAEIVVTKTLAHATSCLGIYGPWDPVAPSYLNALGFLQKLVENGYQKGYPAAMDFGLKGLNARNLTIKMVAIDILTALVKQKGGSESDYKKIITQLEDSYRNDTKLTDKIVKLRTALAEQGYGIEAAIKEAIKTLNLKFSEEEATATPENQAQIIAKRLALFDGLLKNNSGFNDAIKTALDLWHKKATVYISTPKYTELQLNLMFKREAVALLDRLFIYGNGMEEALKLASDAIAKADKEINSMIDTDSPDQSSLDEMALAQRKNIKDLAITLLTSLVKQGYGKSEDYKQILTLLPTLLEHGLSGAHANLCAELLEQGVGVDVILKVAIDRLNNVNQDESKEPLKTMLATTTALLELNQSQTDSIAANNAVFKKIMAQYLDLFNLLLQNKRRSTAITKFAAALWQKPPTQPRYSYQPEVFLFSCKREAVELFELLLAQGYGINDAINLAENLLKQLQDLSELVEKKKDAITEEWKKDRAWQDQEVGKFLKQNLSITYRWNIEKTTRQLEILEMLANRLLEKAKMAQAAQEAAAKATQASSTPSAVNEGKESTEEKRVEAKEEKKEEEQPKTQTEAQLESKEEKKQ